MFIMAIRNGQYWNGSEKQSSNFIVYVISINVSLSEVITALCPGTFIYIGMRWLCYVEHRSKI